MTCEIIPIELVIVAIVVLVAFQTIRLIHEWWTLEKIGKKREKKEVIENVGQKETTK